jgi:hypothetical protein
MTDLTKALAENDRQEIIEDIVSLVDRKMEEKSGVSGFVLKNGYKAIKKLKGGRMIHLGVDGLLDEFTDALDPIYQDYLDDSSADSFEHYLDDHPDRAANALLSVTDQRAKTTEHTVIEKTYGKLRGQAEKHVKDALPDVGAIVDHYVSSS